MPATQLIREIGLRLTAVAAALIATILLAGAQPALAQTDPATADPGLAGKLGELNRLLSDPEVRAAITTASTPVAPESTSISMESAADLWVAGIKAHISRIANGSVTLSDDLSTAADNLPQVLGAGGWMGLVLAFAVIIGLAGLVEIACRRYMSRGQTAAAPDRPGEDLARSALAHQGLGLLVFVAVAVVLFLFVPAQAPLLQPWILATIILRMVRWVTRLSLDQNGAALPGAAGFWLGRMTLTVGILVFGWALTRSLAVLQAPEDAVILLRYVTGLILIVLSAVTIWHHPMTEEQRVAGRGRRIFLTLWLTLIALLEIAGLAAFMWLAVFAVILPPALRLITQAVHRLYDQRNIDPTRIRGRMLAVLIDRLIRSVVIGASALFVVWVLRESSARMHMMGDDMLQRLLQGALTGVVIALLADLAWQALKVDLEVRLMRADEAGDAAQAARNSRIRTLLPIFRSIAGVLILTVALMMILAGLGVEIGPLIAGAGVFGVAIGFGSQTLVRDVISGIFYMLDDAFRVGEYIQSGSYRGTVEGFSLRSVRLRHHRGPIFTVPFGTLGAVQNMSRDWSKDKFLLTVTYDTDIEKVRKLVKKVGETLLEDEEFGHLFIQPMKMKGVESFGEYGITLGVAMIVKPTPLLSMIRRRAYMMIRTSFQENGVEFAVPTVSVAASETAAGTEAASAAAAQAARRLADAKKAEEDSA